MIRKSGLIPALAALAIISCSTMEKNSVSNEKHPVEKSLYEQHIDGANEGKPEDEVSVGISFEEGNGVAVDYSEAMIWYKKAAAKGDPEAYYRIGLLYEKGLGVAVDKDSALEWFLSSASNSYIPAIRSLIDFYEGYGDEQNKWIKAGMKAGDPYSTYRYGLTIESTDRDQALKCFIRGGDSDNVNARAMYAIISLGGRAPKMNEKEAVTLIGKSADEGNARSLLFMGWLYEFGVIVQSDSARAFKYFEASARQGNQMALYNLSRCYGEGIGVEKDYKQSMVFQNQLDPDAPDPSYNDLIDLADQRNDSGQLEMLYRFKAADGDLEAQYHLGLMAEGDDALRWFWQSANEGYVPSMVELARRLRTEQPVQSAAWLMVAENKGYRDESFTSKELMKDMSKSEKLEVSKLFTELFYRDNSTSK